ncbi:hypothetical protein UFOVP1138_89, partial [uncultured Caudovirales phage]
MKEKEGILGPHLVWACDCEACKEFRSYAEAARIKAFEMCS